ncbi:MAG TPA: hypothetical protein PLI09_08475 [Candidatus Hydrogenedentes bacterium]|nr:hypothetical protein [Candidatus Hydrogenedentota bacterium]
MSVAPVAILLAMIAAEANENYAVFESEGLRCIIGNNAQMDKHNARYNGVFCITAPGATESPFVQDYAGLNLEHYFDARPRLSDRDLFFEPRVAPMSFARINNTTAELHQPATPFFNVESWTRFEIKGPQYIDMQFRCIPRKDVFQGGFFGVFWASYINAPEDKSMYFLSAGSSLDKPQWVQLCTQKHGVASSVRGENDVLELPYAEPDDLLYANSSLFQFSEPFFYGRVRDQVLMYIFQPGPVVRFAHSPSGGGRTASGDDTNPAWDFQLIVPRYEINKEYALNMRLVCKPWAGREDVLKEVRKYLGR